MMKIPLHAHDGSIRAYATVDDCDAAFCQYRWHMSAHGYAARNAYIGSGHRARKHRVILLHREILGIGRWAGIEGDHVNRDRLDNRRDNLRALPKGKNEQNQSSQRNASSQYRGVSWDGRTHSWKARVKSKDGEVWLGRFANEIDAANAASAARLRLLPYTVEESK